MIRLPFAQAHPSSNQVVVLASVFIVACANGAFYANVLEVYPIELRTLAFLGSLVLVPVCANLLLLSPACFRWTLKPLVSAAFLISSVTAYFMDTFGVVIDEDMIQNIARTDAAEVMDLISVKLVAYVILLGVLPSVLLWRADIRHAPPWRELASRGKLILGVLLLMAAAIYPLGGHYASFLREHKPLRKYLNPLYPLYAVGDYAADSSSPALPLKPIGLDARRKPGAVRKKLIVLVIGEGARADRFSLNGYPRETNPLLKRERVVSFTNFWACGTSTAVSVPCMLSAFGRAGFDKRGTRNTENLLDVLQRAGVRVLWRDNNSDSTDVAGRVPYEDFKRPDLNPDCDAECRDEGMLEDLPAFVAGHPQDDLFIVLHQMGNHGPAYFKRCPEAFRRFTPDCRTGQIEECSRGEIDNAYDNAIVYTDYFLSRVIQWLKTYGDGLATAMVYVSDHGESLGENGIYLHALPYFIAPDEQKRVPAIFWFGEGMAGSGINFEALREGAGREYSNDHIFHTLLGMMGVDTSAYDPRLDIIRRLN